LPFLSTVMEQERFREGRLTTGYIAEEFPEGFSGAALSDTHMLDVTAAAAIMMARREQRRTGAATDTKWHVQIGDKAVPVTLHQQGLDTMVDVGWRSAAVRLHWQSGDRTARLDWSDGR